MTDNSPKRKAEYCTDCEIYIPPINFAERLAIFTNSGGRPRRFKDGLRCSKCSDKKLGNKKEIEW